MWVFIRGGSQMRRQTCRTHRVCMIILFLTCVSAGQAIAGIALSGDVDPNDPNTWDVNTDVYVGKTGSGMVTVDLDANVQSKISYIGYEPGSTGMVTVDGNGSTWTNSSALYAGYGGSGTLIITSGGAVNSYTSSIGLDPGSTGLATVDGNGSTWTSGNLYVGRKGSGTLNITNGGTVSSAIGTIALYLDDPNSIGEVTVDGAGSIWTNSYLRVRGNGLLNIINGGAVDVQGRTTVAEYGGNADGIYFDGGVLTTEDLHAGASQLTGTGTINTNGLVSDANLVFDSNDDFTQTITFDSLPGQNVTINLDLDGQETLGVGYTGSGSLAISNGVQVNSLEGYLGHSAGSTGLAVVDGNGSTWTNTSSLRVGRFGSGTLNITNGGAVSSGTGLIGDYSGSTGVVTVDGNDSTWTSSGNLFVGMDGSGTLNIINGGAVDVQGDTYIARDFGSAGEIYFDGGVLTTGSLLAGASQLTGTGTINTNGLVSDVGLVFDSNDDFTQTLTLNSQPGQNITINLEIDGQGNLGAGYAGNGSLTISNGVEISSSRGYLGYKSGSTGLATVDGNGSTWTNNFILIVGNYGSGTLNITNGGTVSNQLVYIAYDSNSTGEVTVDGTGSTWTDNGGLYIGLYGSGTLNITNGGAVSNDKGVIGHRTGSAGVVTVDGAGSTWTHSEDLHIGNEGGSGTLNITNGGAVSDDKGIIGDFSNAVGVVTVDGNGSTWTDLLPENWPKLNESL